LTGKLLIYNVKQVFPRNIYRLSIDCSCFSAILIGFSCQNPRTASNITGRPKCRSRSIWLRGMWSWN